MSKTILILGGSGKVSRALTTLLTTHQPPYKVYSLIRNSAQSSSLSALGATPVVQSIEDSSVSELAATISKHSPDVVVWAAGAGGGDPERTKTVDHEGAVKSFDACKEAGVKRYIIVSALDMRDRSKPAPAWYNEADLKLSERVWGAIGPYMSAKLAADTELVTGNATRKLDYTIVRPGQLVDTEGTGKVSAGKVHLGSPVSRKDVAHTILEVIKNDGTIGLAFDVVGGDTDVRQAVQEVVAQRADTFEGLY